MTHVIIFKITAARIFNPGIPFWFLTSIIKMGSTYQIQDQQQVYFFTFQVVGWADIFRRKIYRDIILDSFVYCRKNKGLLLFAYVIMTNHVHTIMQSKVGDLSGLVRDFKKFTSKRILKEVRESKTESRREWLEMIFKYHAKYNKRTDGIQLWTHKNHAVELSSNDMIDSRLTYIHENPVRAGWVDKEEEYLYSSARNYTGLPALIEVECKKWRGFKAQPFPAPHETSIEI